MASSSDVVKRVKRWKIQLKDSADSATVVKILQKLKDLEITLDILAETGIGKTVNSLRRHKQAGEIAKSLVSSWKRLVPKGSTSQTEDVAVSKSLSAKDKVDQSSPKNGRLTDLNNNCLTSYSRSHESSDEADSKRKRDRKADSRAQKTHKKEKGQKRNKRVSQIKLQEFQEDSGYVVSKKEKMKSCLEDTQKPWSCREKIKNRSENERNKSGKESQKKLKISQGATNKRKDSLSFNLNDKTSKSLQEADVRNYKSSEKSRDSDDRDKTRKRKEKHVSPKSEQESETVEHKNKKLKQEDEESNSEEQFMSFESFLNYDVKVCKRKEKSAAKKVPKKNKTSVREEDSGDLDVRVDGMDSDAASPKPKSKGSIMDLINIPLPAALPECDKPSYEEYLERKVEREPDFCDEDSQVFTGQRLNKKMQVYSGNKSVSLPVMMTLHQQCIRTLQNNINLLYETGGVPLEILEPVLERCTPEQLLRIEECNPIYIGATDHLWGKHCQRDFKDSKLQEYESWKEMYMRLYEERERKFKRLTKSISSAHSSKPKGRQVKMAFVHSVAKPPRDVRIQQEIHGTAAQPLQQLRCSVKVQESRAKTCSEEHSRSSSTSSGGGNAQDTRKKSKVAPIMAKSLKAFKKQMGRR